MTGASLSVKDMAVSYGRAQVLHSVSIDVPAGSLITIIGANGAGKTTLLSAIMGIVPGRGKIELEHQAIEGLTLEARVSAGMCLVPERRELFSDMTVEDNLWLGSFRSSRAQRKLKFAEVLEQFPRLKERRLQIAGTLSGGERQMLAMGRALMAEPKVLLLDEPSLGLAPRIVKEVFQSLASLRATGVTILLVEQNARAALKAADYAYVMELGSITAHGTPADILENGRLVESYLGFGGDEH